MNIYYFDPSLNCALFFISLSLYPITLFLSLAFSIFTHYPLTHFLIPSCSFLLSPLPVFFTYSCFFRFFSFVSSLFNIPPPPLILPCSSPSSTVKTRQLSSKLELGCLYSERSQVQSAYWKYQNKSRRLQQLSNGPGSITTILPFPITSDTAGNYTCTLQLKNGQTVWATQAVILPHEGGRNGMVSHRLVCFLIFFINSVLLYYQHRSPCRLPVNSVEIMNHECGWFSDMCSVKRSTVHSSQPQVNSSARKLMLCRGRSSWQIPYVILFLM